MSDTPEKDLTFWEHLDDLRRTLFRILIAVVAVMVAVFLCKDTLFDIVFAPQHSDFVIYRFFCYVGEQLSLPAVCPGDFEVQLINTQLAKQFLTHLSMSFYVGILVVFPYILYQLFLFIAPALRAHERRHSAAVIIYSSLLFYIGVALNYFLVFPLSFRFLATYQVSGSVSNMIELSSYTGTLLMLSLLFGIMSELPVVSWLLAKIGLLTDTFMRKYRKHAVVIILVLSAVITPSGDAFTLFLVFVPIYFFYELSIWIVKRTVQNKTKK